MKKIYVHKLDSNGVVPTHALIKYEPDGEDYIPFVQERQVEVSPRTLAEAITVLVDALEKDKEPGSYCYAWQANIAMAFYDCYNSARHKKDAPLNSKETHEVANEAAKNFLDILCMVTNYNRSQGL